MIRYYISRLLYSILVLLGVVTIVFFLTRATGDPAALLIAPDAGPEEAARVREILGLDRPLPVQYVGYLGDLLRGDLGTSFRQGRPALSIVLERLPATLALAGASMAFAIVFGGIVGLTSALKPNSVWDRLGLVLVLVGQTAPPFWLGIVAILVFGVLLGWLPVIGMGGPEHLVLPALTLGAYSAAIIARMLRASLIEALSQDYVRTAHSKGLEPRVILVRHVVKNAALPVVTIIGLQVGIVMGGSVIIESVFSYPGMGHLAVNAIYGRDFPVIQAYVLLLAFVVTLANLLVDMSYPLLDPRIRYEK